MTFASDEELPYRNIPIKDLCITNAQAVSMVRDAVDFMIVKITINNKEYDAYIGNHPQVDSAINQIQTGPFIMIQGENVYKSQNRFFPSYIHLMGVKDLSIIPYIEAIEAKESC